MEFQQYFHELQTLCDDNSADAGQVNYFDLMCSKSSESMLSYNGADIMPPILSETERQEMREFRRKAVNLERKLFERRREKYSHLLLQVMELTDKFQALEGTRFNVDRVQPVEHQSQTTQSTPESLPAVPSMVGNKTSHETVNEYLEINKAAKNSKEEKNNKSHEKNRLKDNELKDDNAIHSSIFQKPKIHHSSSRQSQTITKSFNSSLHSTTPIDEGTSKSVQSSRSSVLMAGSVGSSNSTLKASHESISPSEAINTRQDLYNPTDSLASTVLSMAFTDSSFVSQHSMLEQPSKSAQRQLNMDQANHTLYESYYQKVTPLTSTPTDLHQHQQKQRTAAKKVNVPSSKTNISGRVYTKADAEQDKALEKLEMMKRKLLQEKEKHMLVLKQQELARLRKGKERSQMGHYSDGAFEISSQGHFSSRPNSDMYSIPEQSFDDVSSLRQEDHNEVESASDKENNIYKEDMDHFHHNDDYNSNHFEPNIPNNNDVYDLQERFSGEIDSRPISVQSKQNISKENRRRSSLYVRQEFQKQFEIEMNKETNGKDKFCILSAYAKGFMTRRLLKTKKIQAIAKTIKDTSDFLLDISKEGTTSYQDKSLQDRVKAQLFAAKSKLYDIFFNVPVHEQMVYISHSRNAAKEREDRMNAKKTETKQLTRKLSAATMKAMQRRQNETNSSSDVKKTSPSSKLGKRSMDTRALKPVQSTKSPQATLRSQVKRRSLASPLTRRSIGKKATSGNRPATALGTKLPSNRKSISRSSTEADKSIRQPRTSLDNRPLSSKRSKSAIETSNSKLPIKKHGNGSSTYRVSKEDLVNDKPKSRPSTATVPSQAPSKRQSETRPKSVTVGTRRVTRAMAAQFNKQ